MISRECIARVDGNCFFELLERFVKKPNVSIDKRKLILRLIQIRIQSQSAAVFLNGLVVRKMISRRPEKTATSQVRLGFGPTYVTVPFRATRETELAALYPLHVVCAWIGNSRAVAQEHYLQVTDAAEGEVAVGTPVTLTFRLLAFATSADRRPTSVGRVPSRCRPNRSRCRRSASGARSRH